MLSASASIIHRLLGVVSREGAEHVCRYGGGSTSMVHSASS